VDRNVQDDVVPAEGSAQDHFPLPLDANNNLNQSTGGGDAMEEDQNLITPMQNINRYLAEMENNHPMRIITIQLCKFSFKPLSGNGRRIIKYMPPNKRRIKDCQLVANQREEDRQLVAN
jgi:hypothetical protein